LYRSAESLTRLSQLLDNETVPVEAIDQYFKRLFYSDVVRYLIICNDGTKSTFQRWLMQAGGINPIDFDDLGFGNQHPIKHAAFFLAALEHADLPMIVLSSQSDPMLLALMRKQSYTIFSIECEVPGSIRLDSIKQLEPIFTRPLPFLNFESVDLSHISLMELRVSDATGFQKHLSHFSGYDWYRYPGSPISTESGWKIPVRTPGHDEFFFTYSDVLTLHEYDVYLTYKSDVYNYHFPRANRYRYQVYAVPQVRSDFDVQTWIYSPTTPVKLFSYSLGRIMRWGDEDIYRTRQVALENSGGKRYDLIPELSGVIKNGKGKWIGLSISGHLNNAIVLSAWIPVCVAAIVRQNRWNHSMHLRRKRNEFEKTVISRNLLAERTDASNVALLWHNRLEMQLAVDSAQILADYIRAVPRVEWNALRTLVDTLPVVDRMSFIPRAIVAGNEFWNINDLDEVQSTATAFSDNRGSVESSPLITATRSVVHKWIDRILHPQHERVEYPISSHVRGMLVLAPSGSGKSMFVKAMDNDLYVDLDDIISWPDDPTWWEDDDLNEKQQWLIALTVEDWLFDNPEKIGFYADDADGHLRGLVDAYVLIDETRHIANLTDRDRRPNIQDWGRIKRMRDEVSHEVIFNNFDQLNFHAQLSKLMLMRSRTNDEDFRPTLEKVYPNSSLVSKYASRAVDKILDSLSLTSLPNKVLCLAEAPGSFATYAVDSGSTVYGVSLTSDNPSDRWYESLLVKEKFHLRSYRNNDLTDTSVVHGLRVRLKKVPLVVADGGFRPKDFDRQEQEWFPLVYGELDLGYDRLVDGGNMLVKISGFFTHDTRMLIQKYALKFRKATIIKPIKSRPTSMEHYVLFTGKNYGTSIGYHPRVIALRMMDSQIRSLENVLHRMDSFAIDDVCCGNGADLPAYVPYVSHVTLVDHSNVSLEEAVRRHAEMRSNSTLRVLQQDCLTFLEHSHGNILNMQFAFHFFDPEQRKRIISMVQESYEYALISYIPRDRVPLLSIYGYTVTPIDDKKYAVTTPRFTTVEYYVDQVQLPGWVDVPFSQTSDQFGHDIDQIPWRMLVWNVL
jgi:23S rRNA U2552 (ribose-2'-O)-methylase RlmE/FtsJ